MTDLWEGARRLPYFYTVAVQQSDSRILESDPPKEWVFCTQCALEHRGEDELKPQYTTLRSLMCCRCGILMGPINRAETG
jgi:hypothetical protein